MEPECGPSAAELLIRSREARNLDFFLREISLQKQCFQLDHFCDIVIISSSLYMSASTLLQRALIFAITASADCPSPPLSLFSKLFLSL